ncbi:MAG: sel1 repeat family protein [Hyphomicrobiaceae bacterium]|nr:sel1 repeat family protein [Hyphomicrobiaceae bacterium]
MSRWLTASLATLAVASIVGMLSWPGGKPHLAAAEMSQAGALAKTGKTAHQKARRQLESAAKRGEFDAQLKLARMYAAGIGVEHSDVKAFELYLKIITEHVNVRPYDPKAQGLAQAFVALGNYYRTGIPGSTVRPDARQAVSVLRYAASYFGNAEAQSNLAQMYLDGEGVQRNSRLALNWLVNAANKRHAKSQAILGDLLWRGAEGVPRQPNKGLALLELARQNASGKKEIDWIEELYAGAVAGSKLSERQAGAKLAASWQDRMGRPKAVTKAADVKPKKVESRPEQKAAETKAVTEEKATAAADLSQAGVDGAPAPR